MIYFLKEIFNCICEGILGCDFVGCINIFQVDGV